MTPPPAPPQVLLVITVSPQDAPLLIADPSHWMRSMFRRTDPRPPWAQAFEACTTRDQVPAELRCRSFDWDGDGDVDMNDFGMIQRARP